MRTFALETTVPVRRASADELAELARFQNAAWPANLSRFALFKWIVDSKNRLFRAVTWDPLTSYLYAQEVNPEEPPESSRWAREVHVPDTALFQAEISIVAECVRPAYMQQSLERMRPSCLNGLAFRNMLAYSFCMLDTRGQGNPEDFIFNDLVIVRRDARREAIKHIISSLKKKDTYRPYILTVVSTFMFYGGGPTALIRRAPDQGGPSVSRVGKNTKKPGRLSRSETRRRDKAAFNGTTEFERQTPVRLSDESKFVKALTLYWAKGKQSIAETYRNMIGEMYKKYAKRLCPTEGMFRYHAGRLIKVHDLKHIRLGHRLAAQHNDARIGQSRDITQGVVDILDVDGTVAKAFVAANIKGRIEPVQVWIIFGVSRLSGAVLGYEIALEGEKNDAYRACIASAFMSKQERATQLGLGKLPGLVHGNIDGIFVDNGPGAAEAVSQSAIDEMGLMREVSPGGRGDLKGVGEGLNSIMIRLMADAGFGYTRASDVVAKEARRDVGKLKPIPLDDFERFLLKAIHYYNRYTDKRRLRTEEMRKRGCGIYPASIFKYTQSLRYGDAARPYTAAEVIDKFIPWVPKACRNGLVHFSGARFSSESMREFFDAHAAGFSGKVPNPDVEVKRKPGTTSHIQWRRRNGTIELLNMVDEDRDNFGTVSWTGLALACLDDNVQGDELKAKAIRPKGRLKEQEQEKINAAERGRGNPIAALAGPSKKAARSNAARKRDAELNAPLTANIGVPGHESLWFEPRKTPEQDAVEELEADFYASLGLDR